MPFSAGKTSTFFNIKSGIYAYDITFPGLIGSVTKDGEVIESSLMKAGGKTVIIDEFQLLSLDVKNAMNSILEYPHTYSRNLGFKIARSVSKGNKYFKISAKAGSNSFSVYSKFSCIAGGMYLTKKSTIDKAWFSRFVPIRLSPSIDWYEKMSKGEKLISIYPKYYEGDFKIRNYLELNEIYWDVIKSSNVSLYFESHKNETGYLVRAMQDVMRISCFIASLNNNVIIRKRDFMDSLKFLPHMLSAYIYSDLDELDFYLVSSYPSINQTEVSEKYRVSQASISRRIEKLQEQGLLRIAENQMNNELV
jgi:hypothetical protein